jgi:hypothetical protein
MVIDTRLTVLYCTVAACTGDSFNVNFLLHTVRQSSHPYDSLEIQLGQILRNILSFICVASFLPYLE